MPMSENEEKAIHALLNLWADEGEPDLTIYVDIYMLKSEMNQAVQSLQQKLNLYPTTFGFKKLD